MFSAVLQDIRKIGKLVVNDSVRKIFAVLCNLRQERMLLRSPDLSGEKYYIFPRSQFVCKEKLLSLFLAASTRL